MLPSEVLKQKEQIKQFIAKLGISIDQIQDEKLLLQAFVHKSFAADFKQNVLHNERLEFLGDGVLSAVINKLLFVNYPEYAESDLTLYKIALVREETLADVAREVGLDKYIFISNGEEKNQGRNKNAILADCLESLLGFLYLDMGIEEVEQFITKYIYSKIGTISKDPVKSYKTMTQEYLQKKYKETPIYKDSEEIKDDKGNVSVYRSEMMLGEEILSEGFGSNKKKAQEDAAKNYYTGLNLD